MERLKIKGEFELENGETLSELTIAYHTYGKLNEDKSNVIWVCHAMTANSDVKEWWPNTVAEGRFLDPNKYFVVCTNFLGSCYGTSGPVTETDNGPLYYDFPQVTIRDMVGVQQILATYLGISKVKALIGSSIGGFQCMEWAIMWPEFAENLILIATTPKVTPWIVAFNESQRMAIELDPTWGELRYDAGSEGMEVARSIGLLSYRGEPAYNKTQMDVEESLFDHKVNSYQRYQGKKLAKRFSPQSYYLITKAVDSHDVGRGRGSVEEALKKIKANTLSISITSDILYPIHGHKLMEKHIPNVKGVVIESEFGHDGFLVESDKLNNLIIDFIR